MRYDLIVVETDSSSGGRVTEDVAVNVAKAAAEPSATEAASPVVTAADAAPPASRST
ncbi:MAG: hypothetical protein ACJ77A_00985 [Actinomycetota bacterium]